MSLLVVGSVAFDAVETPFGKCEKMLGGSASHFSISASYFTDVRIVGVEMDSLSLVEQGCEVVVGAVMIEEQTKRAPVPRVESALCAPPVVVIGGVRLPEVILHLKSAKPLLPVMIRNAVLDGELLRIDQR